MSEQKFPPRIVALRESIKEPHDPIDAIVLDPDGLLHPIHDVVYVSLAEHRHILAEKEKRIEKLMEALERCPHARQCNAPHGQMEKMPTVHELKTALQEEGK